MPPGWPKLDLEPLHIDNTGWINMSSLGRSSENYLRVSFDLSQSLSHIAQIVELSQNWTYISIFGNSGPE